MIKSKKDIIISLEKRVISSITSYNNYEFDLTIEKEDFSKEVLLVKVLNQFDNYKRAFLQINSKENENLNILENQILEKLDLIKQNGDQKFEKFILHYFSSKRLKNLILELEQKTYEKRLENDLDNSHVNLSYVIKLIDNMKIAVNSENSIYKNYKNLLKSNYLSFEEIVKANYLLFSYYKTDILNIAKNLLIPNNADNQWWYSYKLIDSSNFEYIISEYSAKQKENEWVSNLVCELGKNSSKVISDLKNDIKYAINWGRGNLESFDLLIQGFMQDKQVAPSYATWSEENKPINSDHGMHAIVLKKVASMNHEIIDDLIQLAESPDNEISQRKRNEIIATAYLLIGETQKAMDILDSD